MEKVNWKNNQKHVKKGQIEKKWKKTRFFVPENCISDPAILYFKPAAERNPAPFQRWQVFY